MKDLEEKMPSEDFKKFSENSYFTFRCTSKIWSGVGSGVLVWADMTIEQDFMRVMKTTVGLTRGRQISNRLSDRGYGLYYCVHPCVKLWKNLLVLITRHQTTNTHCTMTLAGED